MNLRRTLGAALAITAACTLTPMIASPAAAGPAQCLRYLESKGYTAGSGARDSCRAGAEPGRENVCRHGLEQLGVRSTHADEACRRA